MKHKSKLTLKTLTIKNFATIENQTIDFDDNFNAIVGETGSGKSLILEALQLIFGQRADKKIIRKKAEYAVLEATFHATSDFLKEYFFSLGHPFDGKDIIIKRVIYKNQPSKSFLNLSACSLSTLSNFANNFIDVVGQFENQKLLSNDYQLTLLDSYASLSNDLIKYQNEFSQLKLVDKEIDKISKELEELKLKEDYILFQLQEIENLSPSLEDEQNLLNKKSQLLGHDKFLNASSEILNQLSENDSSNALANIKKAINLLENSEITFEEGLSEKLHLALSKVEEVSYELSSKIQTEENVEEKLQKVMDKLDGYQKLKRKFGTTTEKLLEHYDYFKNEVLKIQKHVDTLNFLEKKRSNFYKSAQKSADKLHDIRQKSATKLSASLTKIVRELKMKGATIKIDLSKSGELKKMGATELVFNAETNPGEGFFKVKDIASGGELSRILLAFRQSLSTNDSISIFLFDEIDSGIGGETALSVGNALFEVSRNSQVLTITHLPQIANFADKLIHVEKEIKEPKKGTHKTESIVKEISKDKKDIFIRNMTPI